MENAGGLRGEEEEDEEGMKAGDQTGEEEEQEEGMKAGGLRGEDEEEVMEVAMEATQDQDGETSRQQDGGDEPAEDGGLKVPPAREAQSGSAPPDSAPATPPDRGGADEDAAAAAGRADVATLEDLEAKEPPREDGDDGDSDEEEEEELIILDAEHPLARRHQAALKIHLSKHLERLNLGLKEKRATEKADDISIQEKGVEIFQVQEQLARLQTKLDDLHQTRAEAEAKRRQAQDRLDCARVQYSSVCDKESKARAIASQLQADRDHLTRLLVLTQGESEALRSDVKAKKNATGKAGAEKTRAEYQKLKQDMYVERLTEEMERQEEKIAMYDAQIKAQAEEKQEVQEALCEAEMQMESMVMAHKQVLQQWSSNLVDLRRQDEAFSAMQEAIRMVEHQVILLDREISGYKKSTSEEEEQNETLTMQLNWTQMDVATTRKLIGQKETQRETLQAQYSACVHTLRETEHTLATLTKENNNLQAELNSQRRQLEKESTARLDLEERIITQTQQKLVHNKAAKNYRLRVDKLASLKREKVSLLRQLESETAMAELESHEVGQRLEGLDHVMRALDEEIAKCNGLIAATQAEISSAVKLVGQKQTTIANYKRKIDQISASTGREDLSPLHIKAEALKAQLEELLTDIQRNQQLWMKRQGTIVELTQKIEANSKDMQKLETEYTTWRQKRVHLESQVEAEQREVTELEKNTRLLEGDLVKLSTLLSKNTQLSHALQQENMLMEKDVVQSLKESERESIEMQMKQEKIQEEKERLLGIVAEAERQTMLWERKIQLLKETRTLVDSGMKGDIQTMKAEIHRMELRLGQLMRQQERLLRESEATVARRETIVLRSEAMAHKPHRQTTKGQLSLIIQGLNRKIKETHKDVTECEQVIRELQESWAGLSDRIAKQKHQLVELRSSSSNLDADFLHLQDIRDKNLANLVTLQNRAKRLQAVCEGSYRCSPAGEPVEAALQSQAERVHAVSSILHRVREEFPEHQGALRKASVALAARVEALEQEK